MHKKQSLIHNSTFQIFNNLQALLGRPWGLPSKVSLAPGRMRQARSSKTVPRKA
jgi:hypothetical protein